MKKMSLANAKQLSRNEMKKIRGGDSPCSDQGCSGSCTLSTGDPGSCRQATNGTGKCYCASGTPPPVK